MLGVFDATDAFVSRSAYQSVTEMGNCKVRAPPTELALARIRRLLCVLKVRYRIKNILRPAIFTVAVRMHVELRNIHF